MLRNQGFEYELYKVHERLYHYVDASSYSMIHIFTSCGLVSLIFDLSLGFVHSAFSFAHESFVTKSNILSTDVPPGALVSFVQKGLQYAEIEAHVAEVCLVNIFFCRNCFETGSAVDPLQCQLSPSHFLSLFCFLLDFSSSSPGRHCHRM